MTRQEIALLIIRISLALTMMIHGIARIYVEGVVPFGEFLSLQGFPFGSTLAWAITGFEVIGGLFFLRGCNVRIISVIFAFQLLLGIILVHFQSGWFVVGLGRNGMEYSVLLIIAFLCVGYSFQGGKKSDE